MSDSVSYGLAKGILAALHPSTSRIFITKATWYIGEPLAKLIFTSLFATGARWIIDKFFD